MFLRPYALKSQNCIEKIQPRMHFLMETPAQQSSPATVSPTPKMKQASTTSYLPLFIAFPNTT